MNRVIHTFAALAALCALAAPAVAQEAPSLLEREVLAKNGNRLGTLYEVVYVGDQKDFVFAVMEDGIEWPPVGLDFVLAAPVSTGHNYEGDDDLSQVNHWQPRENPMLHKVVDDDGDCSSVFEKLWLVSTPIMVNGKYQASSNTLGVVGEMNHCAADPGRLRFFVDAEDMPYAQTRIILNDIEDVFFLAIDEYGPAAAEGTWWARSILSPRPQD